MNNHLSTLSHTEWPRFVPSAIRVFGWLSLLFGVCFGGPQTALHAHKYYIHSPRVTLDRVYAIVFLWSFWGAVSIGYIVCAKLAKYELRAGVIAASILGTGHASVIALILIELHLL